MTKMEDTEYKTVPVVENGQDIDLTDEPASYGYGVRHVQAALVFMCLALSYATRAHLGVTIVAMTMPHHKTTQDNTRNSTIVFNENNTYIQERDVNFTLPNVTSMIKDEDYSTIHKTYDWPKSTQEIVLGAFFFGYCIMMFPMGVVSQKWGGKILLQISMGVNGVLTFFSPWLVAWGDWKALCTVRVLQGFSQAGIYPAILRFIANWVPLSERASLSTYVCSGAGLGTVIAFQLAGILGSSRFGWPSSFWVLGVICLVIFILITVIGTSSPVDNKFISKAEKNFIMGKLKPESKLETKVPWAAIFTSVPAWATFVSHSANATCFVFVFIQVPTYMSAIMKLNIRNNGLLSSLPHVASIFATIAFGFFSDFLTNRKLISIKNARKLSNSIACFIPGLCLTLVSYTQSTALAVICFIVSNAANAALHTGWLVNYVDLSPNYSGALMAIGNTLFGILVTILPFVVSYIVTDMTNRHQWRVIMFLMATLTVVCNIIFLIFMSVDVQPWNDIAGSKSDQESIKLKPEDENKKTESRENEL